MLFESEEPHFYTGDLSDSAALLVRIIIKMTMMIMAMTMTMVLILRSGWVSLSPLGLAMAVVLGITAAVGPERSLGMSENVIGYADLEWLLEINLSFEMNLVFCVFVPNISQSQDTSALEK